MIVYKTASDNYSTVATWYSAGVPYGSLPQPGDDVYANGFTVTINQHITVTKISTELCPTTGLAGGSFNIITFTITANIVAGTTRCLTATAGGTPTFIGNIYGGTGTDAQGVYVNNIGSFTLIGNIYGGSGTGATGVTHYNLTAANITGNIYGGNGAEGMLRALGTGTISVVGNITAGVFGGTISFGNINITGTVSASATAYGITSAGITTGLIIMTGQLINYQEKMAIAGYSRIYFSPSSSTAWTFYDSANVAKPLYTADVLENPPAITDVRDGTIYGIGNNYTGTCAVPPATAVVKSVPVDAGVGTYALSGDLITRLEQCSTVSSEAAALASFEV
jgi:hypothetical protein